MSSAEVSGEQVYNVSVEAIEVEGRFREDYGDLVELSESIGTWGLIQPITLLAKEAGRYKLLAGGRRLAAVKALKLPDIPALVRYDVGDVTALEIELVENIHRKDLTWQERAKLEKKIYELKGNVRSAAELLGESKSLVHNNVVLAEMLEQFPELAEMKSASDALKAIERMKEKAVLMELRRRAESEQKGSERYDAKAYRFASNHYVIGDALVGLAGLNAAAFNMAEVDPPYGIELDEKKDSVAVDDYTEVAPEDYGQFITATANQVYRILAGNTFCIWWFGFQHYELVRTTLQKVGFSVDAIPGIWNKGDQGQTAAPNSNLASCYEPFFIAKKGKPYILKQGRSNVFSFTPVPALQKTHPTERPVELICELLETFCVPGQAIVSPFLGSGATLLAAYRTGRVGLGWDLGEAHRDRFLLRAAELLGELEKKKEVKKDGEA